MPYEARNSVVRCSLLLVLALGAACSAVPVVEESNEPTSIGAESVAPTPDSPQPLASMLPALGMPGRNGSGEPAGVYGWNGPLGASSGMHHVVGEGSASGSRQTVLVFVNKNDCFAGWIGPDPAPITIAGQDGRYVEPYQDPPEMFGSPRSGATSGAYALPVGDRTVCVYLSWDAATTPEELEAARQVVESIRAQPYGRESIRINFTLPQGWDTG
jgi:hypothetical protein